MYYARWASKEEKVNISIPVNLSTGVKQSGVPFMYDDNNLYLLNNTYPTLVIASTGSGKTQSIVLPMLKLSAEAGESVVVSDPNGEVYKVTADVLEKKGYKVNIIDIDNPNYGNNFNPLYLPYDLYISGNKDKSMELIEDLGYYLLSGKSEKNSNSDPFWINSAINFFTGLVLYLFENAKKAEINLVSVVSLANELNQKGASDKFLENIDKNSSIYVNISGTLCAPTETRGSIISVFNQKIKLYISRENLSNMLSTTDFDFINLGNEKTALFIVGGTSSHSENLIPLIINQVCNVIDLYAKKNKMINILLDEFDQLVPIKNFYKLITPARSMYVRFTVIIKSYMDLVNIYGKEDTETLKQCFQNIIYLISSDIKTLEEISKMCGNVLEDGNEKPLISSEELKHLNFFEAIVLVLRAMPIRTKLLPDYKIDWNYESNDKEIPERKINDVEIFKF